MENNEAPTISKLPLLDELERMSDEARDIIVDTLTQLELYKDYIAGELAEDKEDFMLFSDWRDKNTELLS